MPGATSASSRSSSCSQPGRAAASDAPIIEACRDGAGRPARLATCAEADQPVSTGTVRRARAWRRACPSTCSGAVCPRRACRVCRAGTARAAWLADPTSWRSMTSCSATSGRPTTRSWRASARAGLGRRGRGRRRRRATATSSRADGSGRSRSRTPTCCRGSSATSRAASPSRMAGRSSCPARPCALPLLLAHGLRIDGTPAVYCADHAGPRFERYLPTSFALL